MDAGDRTGVSGNTTAGADVAAVERVYDLISSAGLLEGIDELLKICHEDVELSAYAQTATAGAGAGKGGSEVLIGKDAVRAFFQDALERGVVLQVRPRRVAVQDDTVAVSGFIRVTRPDGSFAETGVRWNFRFRDGLVDEVGWEPSAGG